MNWLSLKVSSSSCYNNSLPIFMCQYFFDSPLMEVSPIIQSPPIHFHRPLVYHPTLHLSICPIEQLFCEQQWLKTLFKGLLHINAVRKAAVVHLMRWQQLFPKIFPCSYPFLAHLKSIFVAGISWKFTQVKPKLT